MTRAFSGFGAWLVQRFTAVYMLLFGIVVLTYFIFAPPASYAVWRAWVLSPAMRVATMIFFVALLAHAWVGMRDVILDYVHPLALRLGVLAAAALGLLAIGGWVARTLLVA